MSALLIECDESPPITKRFGRNRSTASTTAGNCFLKEFPVRERMLFSISDKSATMNIFWEELTAGLTNHDQMLRVFIRLCAAIILGGLMGLQRVNAQKPAGLRIHTLVCLGTTVVLLSCSGVGLSLEGAVQGILVGIGFIGAGSILKLSEDHLVSGITVSVRLWTTAAVGIAIGLGQVGIALITAVLVILVLAVLRALERQIERRWRVIPERLPNQSRP
jgi:putative Mg2+ transporter-C (MgtC) family protein